MKVVALVSGGKDSCMSMHLCQTHGHEARSLAPQRCRLRERGVSP